jgi:hypothetical protein
MASPPPTRPSTDRPPRPTPSPWSILAAIGSIETDHGRSSAPGVHSGLNSFGCCAGSMQFNLTDGPPSTWQRYGVDGDHDGVADVYDPPDAIPAAARYLRVLLERADGNLRQAILGYDHPPAYVTDVLARARAYAGVETHELTETAVQLAAAGCAGLDVPAGEADLRRAERVTAPRANRPLPAWAMAPGRGVEVVDVRPYDDVLWLLRGYHLRVTAAREAGHHTHGDGTAVDLIPADGTTQGDWDASAGALARALGWRAECGSSGSRPACSPAPAIQFVGYDGYPGHGSPRTCGPGCPAHIHISWASPCYGTSGVSPPCEWAMAFSAPSIKGGDLVFDRTIKAQPSARSPRSAREGALLVGCCRRGAVPSASGSDEPESAVDADHLAGDPVRGWIGERHDPARHVRGLTATPERDPLAFVVLDRFDRVRRQPAVLERLAFGRAWGDGVDADAAIGELERPASRQVLERRLARAILADARGRLVPERARDVHDRPTGLLQMLERELRQ